MAAVTQPRSPKWYASMKRRAKIVCPKCGGKRKFYPWKSRNRYRCQTCHNEYARNHQRAHPEYKRGRLERDPHYFRRSHLKRRYDMTLEQYDALVEKQGGRCAICKEKRKLDVDHCHRTGKRRALLCRQCNTRLGILENRVWCRAARAYLSRHRMR